MEILDIILPIVYIVVGAALIWFVIELVITIRKVRGKAMTTIDELNPTIKNIETMVGDIQPTIKKVDPLVDRVTLTVDSVNLELMRVDEILEDVTQMTGTISKTLTTVDNVTSAPVDIVNSVTKKVRSKFRPKYASDESVAAGIGEGDGAKTNPLVDFADTAMDAADEAIKEQREKSAARKEKRETQAAAKEAKNEKMGATSERLADQILDDVDVDADSSAEANEARED